MKIRSITCFFDPGWPLDQNQLSRACSFLAEARLRLADRGYEVQTARLASVPFPTILPDLSANTVISFAKELEEAALRCGIEYISIGPALPHLPASYQHLASVLAATQNVFVSGIMTTPDGGVSLHAVRSCAEIIHLAAGISPDGFANLRFAALANTPPGVPFFPAAYSPGGPPAFALGLEAADLAVDAAVRAASLSEMRQNLISAIEDHAGRLSETCFALERDQGLTFTGLDFTLAPFPQEACSLGTAVERMGVPSVGLHGTLAGMAFLADTLDQARFKRAGYNGLFLPVLEDAALARSAADGYLSIKDLLLCSTVCGTGLDTLPLPGEASKEEIYALLLDVAALALRLDKPLTARLMPIPGKAAGEPTAFDFAFFANSRVMPLQAKPLGGMLIGEENLYLHQRKRHPG